MSYLNIIPWDNFKQKHISSNLYILINHDSLGNMFDYKFKGNLKKIIPDLDLFEKALKNKIKEYNFKSYQNRVIYQ